MFPRGSSGHEANVMSLFLDNIDVKKESVGGAVCAQFSIGIYNVHDPKINYSKDAHHRFNAKETDWGFTKYVPLTDLRELLPMSPSVVTKQQLLGSGGVGGELKPKLVENNRFLIRVHVRMIKDVSGTLWLNHDTFDSRREIGYVGIKNQGATCYMNSLLQSLFMMTSFKKMLFGIPTEHQEIHRNIPLVLQKFFYNLHVSPTAVSTKELTSSFGWDSYESFVQQDIQELKALLFDSLEAKLKGTPHEKDLDNLFQVSSMRFIKCLNVDYESKSYSTFYDIPLEIKGLPSVEASFKKYIETETLEGNNQYKSETYGYQDAVTGNVFTRFPPILYLNLKRYEYDFMEDRICKVNDYYEFPESINLSPYYSPADAQRDLSQERPENQQYKLFGILVHSGDFGGGHYYSF